jgi:acetyl-CoA synthetase
VQHPERGELVTNVNSFRGRRSSYEEICQAFRIRVPERFNMAAFSVGKHARGPRAGDCALVCDPATGRPGYYSFGELDDLANRFACALRGLGLRKGDVVVSYAAQGLDAAVTHLAAYKLGAIVAPLSLLYGPDTVRHALSDAAPPVIVTQRLPWDRVSAAVGQLSSLKHIIVAGGARKGEIAFEDAIAAPTAGFVPEQTAASDPALLLYTSGSTGLPKGILHAHRFILGYLASVSLFYQLEMDQPGMVLWTPSDWSWIAGIVNVMLTGWHFGQTVVAGQGRFDPAWAFDFLARHGVTHTFLTPTALKRMAEIPEPRRRWPTLALRAIGTGGEPLPSAVLDWSRDVLRVPINEFYGLTEVNHLVGNSQAVFPVKPGSMGRAYPGHAIAVIDEHGTPVPDGTPGEIAARDDDPTLFLGYWKQPERTAAMRSGRWVRTGDFGVRDADGYFWYHGRNDDLIKSAGYRIGPAEVEDCLLKHPAVAEAAVVGLPDPDRGQTVAAFVRLAAGVAADDALARELQEHVKRNLAAYKYPRIVRFVTEYPLTSTGKISRSTLRKTAAARSAA